MSSVFAAQRIVTAMVSPMLPSGELDLVSSEVLARHLAVNSSDAILVGGTTGEGPTLTRDEKAILLRLLSPLRKQYGFNLWLSVGSNNTHNSVQDALYFKEMGLMDAALVVVPYYSRPSQAGIEAHITAVAEALNPVPVVIYNIPSRCGTRCQPETVLNLAQRCGNVLGIKQSYSDLEEFSLLRNLLPEPHFAIWSGDDALTLPMLALGAHGVVSVSSHLVGNALEAMVQAFEVGDVHLARQWHYRLLPFMRSLFAMPNPTLIKTALARLGYIQHAELRLPLLSPKEHEQQYVDAVLGHYQQIENHMLPSSITQHNASGTPDLLTGSSNR